MIIGAFHSFNNCRQLTYPFNDEESVVEKVKRGVYFFQTKSYFSVFQAIKFHKIHKESR